MAGPRRKMDLYCWASIPAIGEGWLMHNADAQCTPEEREEVRGQRRILCFNFQALPSNVNFYFITLHIRFQDLQFFSSVLFPQSLLFLF